jgi:hypothetical protein
MPTLPLRTGAELDGAAYFGFLSGFRLLPDVLEAPALVAAPEAACVEPLALLDLPPDPQPAAPSSAQHAIRAAMPRVIGWRSFLDVFTLGTSHTSLPEAAGRRLRSARRARAG